MVGLKEEIEEFKDTMSAMSISGAYEDTNLFGKIITTLFLPIIVFAWLTWLSFNIPWFLISIIIKLGSKK